MHIHIMPVSAEQWRIAIGSFTRVRQINRVSYTRYTTHSQFLLQYLILYVLYMYMCVYMYLFIHCVLSSCMVNLAFFGVSINNLVFSSADIRLLHYVYLAKCFQYVVAFVFLISSLQLFKVLYSTLFKVLLHMVVTRKNSCKCMHVKKHIFINCKHMTMLCCFFYSCLCLQLLLLCGDVETNPGPCTKICPECSLSVPIKVSKCSCGYCFKPNKITITCPQCLLVFNKSKKQCVCGYIFGEKEDSSSKTLAMRKQRATETADETMERNAKNRKLMAEKRAAEPESVKTVRRESNRIAMAGKRATESEATAIARRTSNRIVMASKRATESEVTAIARRTSNRIAMASKRATESEATVIARRTSNWIAMASKRATESEATAIARRTSNRIAMASKRATECEAITIVRRERSRIAMAGKRATESEATTIARRTSNRIAMAGKRSCTSTIDDAIKNFHLRVKQGPNFACISCHRLLYKQSVISFNVHKYTKCSTIFCHLSILVISSGCVGHVMVL